MIHLLIHTQHCQRFYVAKTPKTFFSLSQYDDLQTETLRSLALPYFGITKTVVGTFPLAAWKRTDTNTKFSSLALLATKTI